MMGLCIVPYLKAKEERALFFRNVTIIIIIIILCLIFDINFFFQSEAACKFLVAKCHVSIHDILKNASILAVHFVYSS